MPGAPAAPRALWAQQRAQPVFFMHVPLSGRGSLLCPVGDKPGDLVEIKPLGCCPGSHTLLPLPRHQPGRNGAMGGCGHTREGCRWHHQPCGCQCGRASLGWAHVRGSSSSPAQLERDACSQGWKAKSEHDTVLLGVPLATETPVHSPHILPGVLSALVQLHSPPALCPVLGWEMLQLHRGQLCQSYSEQWAGIPH